MCSDALTQTIEQGIEGVATPVLITEAQINPISAAPTSSGNTMEVNRSACKRMYTFQLQRALCIKITKLSSFVIS